VQQVIGQTVIGQDANGKDVLQDLIGPQRFSFYDADGRLQYAVDATGAVYSYAYNAAGQMTSQISYAKTVDTAAGSRRPLTPRPFPDGDRGREQNHVHRRGSHARRGKRSHQHLSI